VSSTARAILSALLLAVLSSVQLVAAPVAAADVTSLCTGYVGCGQQGMSDAGYARASGAMYWRMYAGHNCTNYAAYRMVQSGLPNSRPWDGAGNATYWGTSMADITDGVPAVGSVAWWRAGVYPAGSAGHVAYVERVVSPDTIIVSQDSWGGDFSWARITRGSRGWPSGFIHFNDVPLTNTAKPTVDGLAKVGSTLTSSPGTWSPTANVSYQWRAGGLDVPGATGPAFTVGEAQLGQRLRVVVTASKPGYPTTTASSARTAPVLRGTLASSTAPSISGDPVVDGALTAAAGSWEPAPDAVTFQWLADGVPIEGAVGEQLTPGVGLVGSALSVRVTASRSGYTDVSVTSAATDPVTQAKFTDVTDAVLSGTPRLGETLRLAAGSTAPEASPTIAWQRDGETIADASGTSYVLTADDLGTRISALVRWDRPGYVPAEAPTLRTSRVKATPTLDVRVRTGARGAVRIRADVAVPDGASLPAQVFVRSGRTRQPVPLVDGTAVTVLTELRPGTRTLRVVLPPTHTVAAAVWSGEVTIP
jgi:surface antigen